MRRSPLLLVAVTASLLLTAACGSTVPLAQQQAAGSGQVALDGLPLDGAAVPGGEGTDAGAQVLPEGATVAAPGGVSGGGGSTSTGPTASGPTSGPAAGRTPAGTPAGPGTGTSSVPAKGPGWDEENVYLGVITQKDAKEVFARFGGGVDPGDTEAQARAVAADLNAKGGILGRKVVLVFRDQPTLETATDPNSAGAAACTSFSQDERVLAVVNVVTVLDYPPFRACLAKAGIPLFSASVKSADDTAGRSLAPHFYQSVAVSWDALAPVLVTRLQAQGWFGGWNARTGTSGTGRAKVGVLVDGTDVGTRVGKTLQRVFAAAGYRDTLVYQYVNASDGQGASVNYFNGNGVTHVVVTDVELLAFQSSANGQGYRPRYGITTYNAPHNNLESSLSPAGANNGAVGVGWAPALDVAGAQDPGDTPGGKACRATMAKGGQTFTGKRLAESLAGAICDAFRLISAGASAGGGFTPAQVAAGIAEVGPSFPTAVGFRTGVAKGKAFVPGRVRDIAWDTGCGCVVYRAGTADL